MLYAPSVIRECQHSSEINTFYKGLFRAAIREMTEYEFNQFCSEVLQLLYYHEATVGKWCTDMPQLFKDHTDYFYRITFPVTELNGRNATIYFSCIIYSRVQSNKYSTIKFQELFEAMSDREFYFCCNHILQLDMHKAFAATLYYTDQPEEVKMTNEVNTRAAIFPLSPVNWEEPLNFGVVM